MHKTLKFKMASTNFLYIDDFWTCFFQIQCVAHNYLCKEGYGFGLVG